MGNESLMDMEFYFGVIKMFWSWIEVTVAQHGEYAKCH